MGNVENWNFTGKLEPMVQERRKKLHLRQKVGAMPHPPAPRSLVYTNSGVKKYQTTVRIDKQQIVSIIVESPY